MRTIATISISGKRWFYITWKYCRGTVNLAAKMCQTCNPFSRAKICNSNYTIGNFIITPFFCFRPNEFHSLQDIDGVSEETNSGAKFFVFVLESSHQQVLWSPIKMRVFHQKESCLSCLHPPSSYEGRRKQGRQLSF